MMHSKRYGSLGIAASTLIITYLHYSTNTVIHAQHDLYRELYYLPVLFGALMFGLRGALATYLAVLALYLPYVLMTWTGDAATETNRIFHLILQGLFAVIAGFLIDRDRRQRKEVERERYLAGIGRAATAIVHDIKSPLIAILGFARRLKEKRGSVDAAVDAIIDSAEHIEKIAHDTLDFAKPLGLDRREEDLRVVVRGACATCRALADAAGVELSLDLPPHPVRGSIDSARMERAINNLISNAVEASGRSQIVTIRVSSNGTRAVIAIKDNGSGMDAEALENMFVPFYTKKRKGTGIGMPMSKKIIEGHGGAIAVRSRPGVGTEISVVLPTEQDT